MAGHKVTFFLWVASFQLPWLWSTFRGEQGCCESLTQSQHRCLPKTTWQALWIQIQCSWWSGGLREISKLLRHCPFFKILNLPCAVALHSFIPKQWVIACNTGKHCVAPLTCHLTPPWQKVTLEVCPCQPRCHFASSPIHWKGTSQWKENPWHHDILDRQWPTTVTIGSIFAFGALEWHVSSWCVDVCKCPDNWCCRCWTTKDSFWKDWISFVKELKVKNWDDLNEKDQLVAKKEVLKWMCEKKLQGETVCVAVINLKVEEVDEVLDHHQQHHWLSTHQSLGKGIHWSIAQQRKGDLTGTSWDFMTSVSDCHEEVARAKSICHGHAFVQSQIGWCKGRVQNWEPSQCHLRIDLGGASHQDWTHCAIVT